MGVASALCMCNIGAAYGTAKSGVGLASLGVIDHTKQFKALIPVIMAGILGIYGIIVAVLLNGSIKGPCIEGKEAFKLLGAGMTCGLSSLASGFAIGTCGDAGVRAYSQSNNGVYVGLILIMIFAEAIGLYGLIVAIILQSGS